MYILPQYRYLDILAQANKAYRERRLEVQVTRCELQRAPEVAATAAAAAAAAPLAVTSAAVTSQLRVTLDTASDVAGTPLRASGAAFLCIPSIVLQAACASHA